MPQEALFRTLLEGQVDAKLNIPLCRSASPHDGTLSAYGHEVGHDQRSTVRLDADVRLYGGSRCGSETPNAYMQQAHQRHRDMLRNSHGSGCMEDSLSGGASGELDAHILGALSSGFSAARKSFPEDTRRSFSMPGCDCCRCVDPDSIIPGLCEDSLASLGDCAVGECCCGRRHRTRRNGFLSIRRRRNGFLSIRRRRNGVLASEAGSADGTVSGTLLTAAPLSSLPGLHALEENRSTNFCCARCFRNEGASDGEGDVDGCDGDGMTAVSTFSGHAHDSGTGAEHARQAGGLGHRSACTCRKQLCRHSQQRHAQAFSCQHNNMRGGLSLQPYGPRRARCRHGYTAHVVKEEETRAGDALLKPEDGPEDTESRDEAWYPQHRECRCGPPMLHHQMGGRSLSLPMLPNTEAGPYATLGLSQRLPAPATLRKARLLTPSPQLQPLLQQLPVPQQPSLQQQPLPQPLAVTDGTEPPFPSPLRLCKALLSTGDSTGDESGATSSVADVPPAGDPTAATPKSAGTATASRGTRFAAEASSGQVDAHGAAQTAVWYQSATPAGSSAAAVLMPSVAPASAAAAAVAALRPHANANALRNPPRGSNHAGDAATAPPSGPRLKLLPLPNPGWRLRPTDKSQGPSPDVTMPMVTKTGTTAAACAAAATATPTLLAQEAGSSSGADAVLGSPQKPKASSLVTSPQLRPFKVLLLSPEKQLPADAVSAPGQLSHRPPPRRTRSLAALVHGRCLPRLPQHSKQQRAPEAGAPRDPSALQLAGHGATASGDSGDGEGAGRAGDSSLRRSISWASYVRSRSKAGFEGGQLQALPPPIAGPGAGPGRFLAAPAAASAAARAAATAAVTAAAVALPAWVGRGWTGVGVRGAGGGGGSDGSGGARPPSVWSTMTLKNSPESEDEMKNVLDGADDDSEDGDTDEEERREGMSRCGERPGATVADARPGPFARPMGGGDSWLMGCTPDMLPGADGGFPGGVMVHGGSGSGGSGPFTRQSSSLLDAALPFARMYGSVDAVAVLAGAPPALGSPHSPRAPPSGTSGTSPGVPTVLYDTTASCPAPPPPPLTPGSQEAPDSRPPSNLAHRSWPLRWASGHSSTVFALPLVPVSGAAGAPVPSSAAGAAAAVSSGGGCGTGPSMQAQAQVLTPRGGFAAPVPPAEPYGIQQSGEPALPFRRLSMRQYGSGGSAGQGTQQRADRDREREGDGTSAAMSPQGGGGACAGGGGERLLQRPGVLLASLGGAAPPPQRRFVVPPGSAVSLPPIADASPAPPAGSG